MTTRGIVLEMTDPAQLVASARQPGLRLTEVPSSEGGRIGSLYRAVWAPIGGGGRGAWTNDQWVAELDQPGTGAWIARLAGDDAGLAQVGWSGDGDAAFVVLGVLPAFQGRGIGGDFLTRLTRHLWRTPAPNGCPTRRVWLWTVPDEHPHTIPNYLARGFRRGPDIG